VPEDAPAGVRGLLAPSSLRPLDLDLRRVFWTLTGVWAVVLAVVLVLAATRGVEGRTVAICATGVALGFLALAWERRHTAAERRRAAST
jgi:heme O synthase-like polyprenyltransferase